MVIRPPRRTGTIIGALLVAACVIVDVGLAWQAVLHPVTLTSFVAGAVGLLLLGGGGLFAYWTIGCWSLRYHLDRNRIEISWAGNTQHIPVQDIQRLVPGALVTGYSRFRGLRWPGYAIGSGMAPGFDSEVLFFSSHLRPEQLLYLVTPGLVYAISVPDQAAFANELRLRQRLGPIDVFEPHSHRWPAWELPAWHDIALIGLLVTGLALNAGLFAFQTVLLPALPAELPVPSPFDLSAHPAVKTDLLALPLAGLALYVVNAAAGVALHLRERFAGYLFPAGALLVQGLLWAATVRAVTLA